MTILSLIGVLIVVCVAIWATRALLTAFAVPDPLRTVIYVVLVLLLLSLVIPMLGIPLPWTRPLHG